MTCTCCASCATFSAQDRKQLKDLRMRLATLSIGLGHGVKAIPDRVTRNVLEKYARTLEEMAKEIK